MPTTEAECLEALRAAARRLGESPTKAQYEATDLTPSSTTICRIVGSWNEAKRRAGLYAYDQDENGGGSIDPKPEWVDLPAGVEWTEITAQQRWYYKNRQHRIETKERRRRELRRWFREVKRTEFSCGECPEDRGPALDFHHPGEKYRGVSQMVNHGYSRGRIREEMERCDVLCGNCHRRKHYDGPDTATLPDPTPIERIAATDEEWQWSWRRNWLLAYKREQGGCTRCSVGDPVCTDLHHRGEKDGAVSKLMAAGLPPSRIEREIEKCILLCVNCHRVEHHTPDDESDGR